MFFLLRACLWIGAIILLVPMLPSMQTGEAPNHTPAPVASLPQATRRCVALSPHCATAPSSPSRASAAFICSSMLGIPAH